VIWALLLIPAVAGLLCLVLRPNAPRRALLVLAALGHSAAVAWAWADADGRRSAAIGAWMAIDEASLVFLSITSLLFLAAAVYAVGYLARENREPQHNPEDGLPFENYSETVFTGCLLAFLATMSLVAVSRHLGLIWVAVEATTLVSAPLIYFHRHHRSLEATWKYLVICSVGIALALLGNFFLVVATRAGGGEPIPLLLQDLTAGAARLDHAWLKAAFLLLLVGYGTKMGLAPMHTWLPDAHSEAPSLVSALLSGALLNCAFLAILRVHGLMVSAGLGDFSRELLVLFGLLSMALASVFILNQADFKRMLAYSSVEHMGILALGIGIGGLAGYGSMLHAVNHSLTKGMLFLAAGNILAACRTKSTLAARDLLRRLPVSGLLWLVGFLAITGSPPFGPFLSELTILKGMLDAGNVAVAVGYLLALAVVFVGMASVVLQMLYAPVEAVELAGDAASHEAAPRVKGRAAEPQREPEPLWSIVPPLALAAAVLVLGLWVPAPLAEMLQRAAAVVGVN